MDEIEAESILAGELSRYRGRSYSEPLALVDREETFERVAQSGVTYRIEVRAFFDDVSRRALRVMASIDDGGWRAFVPMGDDFIMAPDSTFVGEESRGSNLTTASTRPRTSLPLTVSLGGFEILYAAVMPDVRRSAGAAVMSNY